MNRFQDTIKEKAVNIVLVYLVVLLPMWLVYMVNNHLLGSMLNNFGIVPRSSQASSWIGVAVSWLLHGNYNHIVGNSIILVGLLGIVGLLEKNVFRLLALLILGSGLATWLLGGPYTRHVGASGLVFALFGYILISATVARKWLYLLPLVLFGGSYYYSLIHGLVPQRGVSFAAHFGGFIAGLLIGYYFERHQEAKSSGIYSGNYKKTWKQKWQDFKWKMKYRYNKPFSR